MSKYLYMGLLVASMVAPTLANADLTINSAGVGSTTPVAQDNAVLTTIPAVFAKYSAKIEGVEKDECTEAMSVFRSMISNLDGMASKVVITVHTSLDEVTKQPDLPKQRIEALRHFLVKDNPQSPSVAIEFKQVTDNQDLIGVDFELSQSGLAAINQ